MIKGDHLPRDFSCDSPHIEADRNMGNQKASYLHPEELQRMTEANTTRRDLVNSQMPTAAVLYDFCLHSGTNLPDKFMVGYEMLAGPQRDSTPEKAAELLRT
jgi:hypothetical protein